MSNYKQYSYWGAQKIIGDRYEPSHFVRNVLVLNEVKKLAGIKSVCEIGCGLGVISQKVGKLGKHVSGFDLDEQAIEVAKQFSKHPNVTFSASDVFSVSEKKYDLVLNIEVLEHIEQDDEALLKMAGLLNSGGKLIISVPAHEKYRTPFDDRAGHVRRYSKREFVEKLEKNGFRVLKARYFGWPLLKWYYFNVYLRASRNREKIKGKKVNHFMVFCVRLANLVFLTDLLFSSPKGINLIAVCEKK